MKYLIIDSHKGGSNKPTSNLHWTNARMIAERLGADMIWSYPGVNDDIHGGYDVIIFNHASHYSYVDYAWLEASPDAKLFHITNEQHHQQGGLRRARGVNHQRHLRHSGCRLRSRLDQLARAC